MQGTLDNYVWPGSKEFIGPLEYDDLPMYEYTFGHPVRVAEDCDGIIHDGKKYQYEITLSDAYEDDKCCRVNIDGVYYYFG
jgi:hypothetical protein